MRVKWLVLIICIIGLDQLTKHLITHSFSLWDTVTIIPDFFDFTLRHNTGAAYNLLANASGWQRWFLIGVALVVCGVIIAWLYKLSTKEKLEGFALALILSGAIGNLIDRIQYGYVIDFILVHYHAHEFPAFNVADSAISIGVVLLIPALFKKS